MATLLAVTQTTAVELMTTKVKGKVKGKMATWRMNCLKAAKSKMNLNAMTRKKVRSSRKTMITTMKIMTMTLTAVCTVMN